MIRACLFDLDGVVFDTEPAYTEFWGRIGREFVADVDGFEYKIKGQTLVQIYGRFFADRPNLQAEITHRLNDYERQMKYEYVPGFEDFIAGIRKNGMKTALATSSNREKMRNVYGQHAEFEAFFDEILTSEDFAESKPSPDCYLRAAGRLDVPIGECAVFEDSFNGLKAGKASGAHVIGLATTNSPEEIGAFCERIIKNYIGFGIE